MKLRSYLIALVIASVLPVVIFAGLMMYLSYQEQREQLARSMIERARAISAALDREFLISIQSLKVLGASTNLDKGQLAEFHGDMKAALAAYSRAWQNITLTDSSGQQLINLRRPFGSDLPRTGNPEAMERVRQSMKPAIANLSPGPVTGALGIVVHVPVLKDGHVKYFLNAIFYPAPLTDLLLQQNLPLGWIVTILDRNQIIVARTRNIEKFIGKPASPGFATRARQHRETTWQGVTLEKTAVDAALHRSDFSGWTVGVGVATSLLEAPMKRSLMLITGGGLLLFFTGIGLAFLLGSRISRPIAELSAAAAALGKGEIPRLDASPIIEVNEAARAIEDAAAGRDRAEKDALKNYERFLNVARATNDAVWDWDIAANYVWWNEGIRALFGYSMEEVKPDIAWRYQHIHPEDRNNVVHGIQAHFDSGKQYWSDEYRYQRVDGSYADVFDRGYIIRDDRGAPVRMIGAMLDITERKRAERLLRDYNGELEQTVAERTRQLETINKELESFSYSVSHDLRAPLRHIQGFVELLGRALDGKVSEQAARYMKIINDTGAEMGQLIDDLLEFSRSGRVEMQATEVDLNRLAQESIAALASATQERNIVWKTNPLPLVKGDPALLRQVLANLLGNAVKYSRSRDPAEIEIGCDGHEDGRAIVYVRDNGVGFDMQYANKLFGVFQRLHRSDEFEGTGIGLANVKRIVTRHGGRVWAESRLGEGTTLYFSLAEAAEHDFLKEENYGFVQTHSACGG